MADASRIVSAAAVAKDNAPPANPTNLVTLSRSAVEVVVETAFDGFGRTCSSPSAILAGHKCDLKTRMGAWMADRFCTHGGRDQEKFGMKTQDNGLVVCNGCGLPTVESAVKLASSGGRLQVPHIPARRIVTTPTVPGERIVQSHGLVSELTSASGFTASSKGNNALSGAVRGLVMAALELGANAIVGVTSSTFAAHGGITNALGGDAVGVLLMGTAVTVENVPEPPPAI